MAKLQVHIPSVALVYDYVTTPFGGAEVVLEQLHQLYPAAPLFTTVADTSRARWAKGWNIQTTFLQSLPSFLRQRHQWQALLAPLAIEQLDLSAFDIIISVSAGAAKGILTRPDQLHICYLLTPTRYLFEKKSLTTHPIFKLPGIHWLANQALEYLRWWDVAAASRPDQIIAISQLVKRRIKKRYHRYAAKVLYPPYKQRPVPSIALTHLPTPFDLIVSRLVWYKRVGMAIKAAKKVHTNLIIIGIGTLQKTLEQRAGAQGLTKLTTETLSDFFIRASKTEASILFCGALDDTETSFLMSACRSLIMLGKEDFGMTALEALASGKPVIIDAASGVAEVLTHNKTGLLLEKPTTQAVIEALQRLEKHTFSPALLKRTALRYSDLVFRQSFATTVETMWRQKKDYDAKYA